MNEPREYNLASELTDSEIANSIDLRPKVFEIIQTINGFSYLSEIRHFYSKLPRLAIDNKLSAEEVDVIGANLEKKKVGLTAQGIGHCVTEATVGEDKDACAK